VIAIKFITKDTIEEKILRLQEKKSKLAEDIIGDVEKAKFSKGDIEYLFG
jgi:non-specific serine/threonine protein kinase